MILPQYPSSSMWDAPLEDILLHSYPAPLLKNLHTTYLVPAARRISLTMAEKKKKSEFIGDFLKLESNTALRNAFFYELPEKLRQAVRLVAWGKGMPLAEIEEMLGYPLTVFTKEPSPYGLQEKHSMAVLPEFEFLHFITGAKYYYYHSIDRRSVWVDLPPVLADLARQALPIPPQGLVTTHPDYEPTLPEVQVFPQEKDQPAIIGDILQTLEYLQSHPVDLTNDGALKMSAIKALSKFLGDRDFFPSAPRGSVPKHGRARLLGSMLLPWRSRAASLTEGGPEKLGPFFQKIVADLPVLLPSLWPALFPHLPIVGEDITRIRPVHVGLGFFEIPPHMPVGEWMRREALDAYLLIHRRAFALSSNILVNSRKVQRNRDNIGSRWDFGHALSSRDWLEIYSKPLAYGLIFLLASLGFAQVAYTPPCGLNGYIMPPNPWLTPWDGLEAWRLTELGAYAFGQKKEFSFEDQGFKKVRVRFYEDRLLLRVEHGTAVTKSFLDRYLERLSEGFYRFERGRFFKGCQNAAVARSRLEEFSKRVPGQMPPNWVEALRECEKNVDALVEVEPWRIFRVPPDSPLMAHLRTDPVLREHFHKISGGYLGVPQMHWRKVEKHLQELGFFL